VFHTEALKHAQGVGKMVHNNSKNGQKTSKQNENVKGRIL
jgi:hypothetical protein